MSDIKEIARQHLLKRSELLAELQAATARADELQEQLAATEANEQILVDANKPLLIQLATANARADAAEKHNEILTESNREMMMQMEQVQKTILIMQSGVDYCRVHKPERSGGIKWAIEKLLQALQEQTP